MDAASPTHVRLCATLLACTALVCGCTVAYAEPLFFDCHGTYEVLGPRENSDYRPENPDWRPRDETQQIMIHSDKGVVDAPGGGSNEYCARESEWVPCGTGRGGVQKAVKQCITLQISETAYTFYTTSEGRNNCQYGDGPPTTFHNWTMGSLNRIAGKFFAHERVKIDDSNDYHLLTWKMTCTPVQRKF